MDEQHRRLIAALNQCSFQPGSWPKRFARSLLGREQPLSEKQAAALERLRQQYRRQLRRIAPELVADLAEPGVATAADELERLRAWNESAKQFNEGTAKQ